MFQVNEHPCALFAEGWFCRACGQHISDPGVAERLIAEVQEKNKRITARVMISLVAAAGCGGIGGALTASLLGWIFVTGMFGLFSVFGAYAIDALFQKLGLYKQGFDQWWG